MSKRLWPKNNMIRLTHWTQDGHINQLITTWHRLCSSLVHWTQRWSHLSFNHNLTQSIFFPTHLFRSLRINHTFYIPRSEIRILSRNRRNPKLSESNLSPQVLQRTAETNGFVASCFHQARNKTSTHWWSQGSPVYGGMLWCVRIESCIGSRCKITHIICIALNSITNCILTFPCQQCWSSKFKIDDGWFRDWLQADGCHLGNIIHQISDYRVILWIWIF